MPRRANSLYVRHLPDACRHEDVRRAFGRYGRIVDITIPLDYFTGRMKGFAFIEFDDPRDAEDAHHNMDHSRFMGRDIEVEFTRGYRKTPSEMRVKDRPRGDSREAPGRRGRSNSRSRSRSRSDSRRGRTDRRSGGRKDDNRRQSETVRGGRSRSRTKSPTRSRSHSHNGADNGSDRRKSGRHADHRDVRQSSHSPVPKRRVSGSRSRSGSY